MIIGTRIYHSISLNAAKRILDALLADAAADGGKPVAIAVVDDRGDLVAFGRLDGAPARCVAIAINKAYTASRTGQSTELLAFNLAEANRSVDVYTDPRFTLFPGGVPLTADEGAVVGALGISGRLPADDVDLASRWTNHI